MEINSPQQLTPSSAAPQTGMPSLELKLNQVFDAKVIDAQANSYVLAVADKILLVQSQIDLGLQPGLSLKLQVSSISPAVSLTIMPPDLNTIVLPALPAAYISNAKPGNTIQLAVLNLELQSQTQLSAKFMVNPMEINLPLNLNLPISSAQTRNNPLNLQLNQIVSAQVITNQTMLNTLVLSVDNKTMLMQAQQQTGNFSAGQTLQLQVVRLLPTVEFAILESSLTTSKQTSLPQTENSQLLRLLSSPAPDLQTLANSSANAFLSQLRGGQQLSANIVNVFADKITLQVLVSNNNSTTYANLSGPKSNPANQQNSLIITLDSKQLVQTEALTGSKNTPSQPLLPELSLLKPGSELTLQVLKTGSQPSFAISLAKPPAISEQKLNELLKQLLPIQTSPALFLNYLHQVLPSLENNPSVAETLKNLAQQILAAIPQQAQLTQPTQLKQSLDSSGLFLESKFAALLSGKEDQQLHDDVKLLLLKFVQALNLEIKGSALQQSTEKLSALFREALQKTDSSLAKLTLDQFNSLPNQDSAKQTWVFELPFFFQQQASTVHIAIQQDKAGDPNASPEQKSKSWAVSITLTPPDLATIHCRISCYDGAVNTRFWSDAAATVEKIHTHLDYLKQQFEQKGLKTGFMEAQQGKPAETHSFKKPLANLLSEKV